MKITSDLKHINSEFGIAKQLILSITWSQTQSYVGKTYLNQQIVYFSDDIIWEFHLMLISDLDVQVVATGRGNERYEMK